MILKPEAIKEKVDRSDRMKNKNFYLVEVTIYKVKRTK